MASAVASEAIIDFVRQSERISGIGLPDDPAEWTGQGTKWHLEIAKIVASEGGNIVSVSLINSGLTGNKNGWFRTGSEGALRNVIPDGSEVADLIERLNCKIRQGVSGLRNDSAEDLRDEFAWQMHDMLISIHAFKQGNGRTARLLMNHIRIQLGLPWFIVHYDKSQEYYAKLDEYKRNKFSIDLTDLRQIVLEDRKQVA